jgi:hypothetical protein
MKRLYNAILIIILALSVSCQYESSEERDASKLGKAIWEEARLDIEFTLDAIVDVLNIDYIIALDDAESQAELFAQLYGSDKEFDCSDADSGIYRIITRNVTTGAIIRRITYVTNNRPLNEGEWSVTRESGDYYAITFTPQGDGCIKAEYDDLYHVESAGDAEMVFTYKCALTMGVPSFNISYLGRIEMVDPVMSAKKPLTLTIETTDVSHYSSSRGIMQSMFEIICKDDYYDVTDKISVEVIYNSQRSAIITCYGETDTYTM